MKVKQFRLSVLFAAILAGVMLLPGIASAKAAGGTDISSDTVTNYYMHLPINGIRCYMHVPTKNDSFWPTLGSYSELIGGNYTTPRTGTVTVTFNKVLYDGMPVMVTGLARIIYPPNTVLDKTVDIVSNMQVNIRESYYRYFTEQYTEADWSDVSFMFVLGNYGFAGGRMDSIYRYDFTVNGITLSSEDKTNTTDPNSPDFELGDNGGMNANPQPAPKKGWYEKFFDSLTAAFGWKIYYATFKNITVWVIVGLGVLLFVGWIVSRVRRR